MEAETIQTAELGTEHLGQLLQIPKIRDVIRLSETDFRIVLAESIQAF